MTARVARCLKRAGPHARARTRGRGRQGRAEQAGWVGEPYILAFLAFLGFWNKQ